MITDLKAKDIMIKEVATIEADELIIIAKLKTTRKGLGGLPVIENGKLAGIITHRDIILAGENAVQLKVRDIMTKNVVSIKENTSIKEIANIMKSTGYQRLPVVRGKKLVGIVTQSCIINALSGETMNRIITLTTDFGNSEYVGAMKGMIYSICPAAKLVDVAHNIRKFDTRQAAYVLHSVAEYFPKGTVHCAVIDPGVGTGRRGVIVKTKNYFFVGPDNGVFSFLSDIKKVYEISYPAKSRTFHGRDIFAPIAARLACGAKPEEFGTETSDEIEKIKFRKVASEKGATSGEVIYVDYFGNIITNIKKKITGAKYIEVNRKKYKTRFVESYGFAEKGELICLIGSMGYMEIAINQGSAAERLKLKGGEEIKIRE